jgi:hypothetical protein
MGKLHTGIFGPSLSGKTVLAKHLSRQLWLRHGIKSLVLDPIGDDWGEWAIVYTADKQPEFWAHVWREKRFAVFVDEGTEMISRDKDLIPVFTRIRHNQHKLFVVGHRGSSLLPIMRDQISTIFLFRQTKKACEIWAEQFVNDQIFKAMDLNEYEFLWVEINTPKMELIPQKLNLKNENQPAAST